MTAAEARQLAKDGEMDGIYKTISSEARVGHYSTFVMSLTAVQIANLQKLGYQIVPPDKKSELYIISWR